MEEAVRILDICPGVTCIELSKETWESLRQSIWEHGEIPLVDRSNSSRHFCVRGIPFICAPWCTWRMTEKNDPQRLVGDVGGANANR